MKTVSIELDGDNWEMSFDFIPPGREDSGVWPVAYFLNGFLVEAPEFAKDALSDAAYKESK